MKKSFLFIAVLFTLGITAQNTIYIDVNATGNNDGTSWENAFNELQDIPTNLTETYQVWVAQGEYKPGILQTDSFLIPSNVDILGGFNGTETSANQRNWKQYKTIVSGDINNSGTANAGDSHTLVTIENSSNVTIDGFVFKHSFADNESNNTPLAIGRSGGAIYIRNATNLNINNCAFHHNVAEGNGSNGVGGAIINFGNSSSNTTITNSLFFNNRATSGGGAISAESGNIDIINCTIANNEASRGGGVNIFSGTVEAVNSIFTLNTGTNGNMNDEGPGNGSIAYSMLYSYYVTGLPTSITDGGNNYTQTDPLYISGTDIDGFALRSNSPAIDAGNNSANSSTRDLGGNNRIETGTGIIDIGAFEYKPLFTGIFDLPEAPASSNLAWGDYDNDGDLDIMVSSVFTGPSNRGPAIYTNNGDDTFSELNVDFGNIYSRSNLAWGDYDNDGDLDIIFTGYRGSQGFTSGITRLFTNNGNSTFTELTIDNISDVEKASVAWGDYDNDGDLDILISGQVGSYFNGVISTTKVYTNNGDETFSESYTVNLPALTLSSVAWGDYDNDGYLDILLTGNQDNNQAFTKLLKNNGNKTFTENTTTTLTNVYTSSVAWGDYDNDGDLDILLTGRGTNSDPVSKIFRNDNGAFTDINEQLTGVFNGSVAWGDYDNDGDLDVLIAGGGSITKIYINDGNDAFNELSSLGLQGYEKAIWGDYDNDGDLDIAVTGDTGGGNFVTKILKNNISTTNTKPTIPTGLNVSNTNTTSITLAWNASTDNETPSTGLSYNVFIKEVPSGSPSYTKSPMAQENDGWRKLPKLGNAMQNTFYKWNIPQEYCGETNQFEFRVQAIDHSFAGSEFSESLQFTVDLTNSSNILYVNASSSANSPNGQSWATAYYNLQDALNAASICTVEQIWVAAGTYKPGTNEKDSFYLPEGTTLLGGFNGTETSTENRNWAENPTILSGDLNNSEDQDAGDSHSIVTVFTDNVTIDGFIFENSFTDGGNLFQDRSAGGVFGNNAEALQINNCIFRNLIVDGNGSNGIGGAIAAQNSDITIINNLFYDNAAHYGGAISIEDGSSFNLINNTFASNEAYNSGGAINTNDNPITIVNSIFSDNTDIEGNPNFRGNITSISYSYVQNENPQGTENIDGTIHSDPFFVNPSISDYSLQTISPAIDVGDNSANMLTLDLAYNNRILDFDNFDGAIIDLGAYEMSPFCESLPNLLYVNSNATGSNNGTSWANAYTSISDALNTSEVCGDINEIWVATGIYKPSTDENSSFTIPEGVMVLGGFNGTETTANERNWAVNLTVLSGDLNNSNVPDSGDSHHILSLSNDNTTLDGFTIQFAYNDNSRFGAGVINTGNNNNIMNCIFNNNIVEGDNNNGIGAGIANMSGNINVTNGLFYQNEALNYGGAIGINGGLITLINCTIANNDALEGGGIHMYSGSANAINTIFFENSGTNGNMNNDGGGATGEASYSSFYNTTSNNNGNLPPNIDGENNFLNTSPSFTDIVNNDYSLLNSSPLVNAGNNAAINGTLKDLAGNTRIFNTTVDIGAYEVQATLSNTSYYNKTFSVYPNPVKDVLNIKTSSQEYSYHLFNIQGQEVFKANN
ncbi:FG-GAP-like repeat-containing protein, partial [Bizionia sp.]